MKVFIIKTIDGTIKGIYSTPKAAVDKLMPKLISDEEYIGYKLTLELMGYSENPILKEMAEKVNDYEKYFLGDALEIISYNVDMYLYYRGHHFYNGVLYF